MYLGVPHPIRRRRWPARATALLLAMFVLPGGPRPEPDTAGAAGNAHPGHAATMTEAAMRRWLADWYAAHPARGLGSDAPAVATYQAVDFRFELDGNPFTQVDTAKIAVGETVAWQWVEGIHTTTSGIDGADPNAGAQWDRPLDSANPQFAFLFDTPGEYPFFCRPHDFLDMKGVVVVQGTTGVGPGGVRLGFTAGPFPNPSRGGVDFRFALAQPGRVRAEVFDARGRRVAAMLDRDLAAGEHAAAWDARSGGTRAPAGVYYLRLRLPGYEATRRVVLTR